MIIRDISKPITAKALNETLAKKFGQKLSLEKFTVEQLEDARNRLRTSLSQYETNESYDSVQNQKYQQVKLMQDVIVAELAERQKKNDTDVDVDVEEGYKKAKKMKKESVIREGAEDQAELVMAAKDMVDRITGWMEDTAEMQTESMLELADAIRDEMGNTESESFVNTVKPALEQLYAAMETTRGALTQGVGQLTGEAAPAETMGAEPEGGEEEPSMEPTVDQEAGGEEGAGDEFGAAAPAAGGEEESGRARRESIERKRQMIETSRRLGTLLSKKK